MSAQLDNIRKFPDRPAEQEAPVPVDRTGAPWPDKPAPLSTVQALAVFPLAALPAWLADYTEAVAEMLQVPVDLPGSLALAVLSTVAGGRVTVSVREGWNEQPNIYTVVIMEPSARKSPAFTAMTEPIRELEKELRIEAKHQIEAARMQQQVAQSTRDRAQKAAAELAGDDTADQDKAEEQKRAREQAIADAVDAALAADAIEVPAEPRLIVDDITVQKVASILAQQGGRLAVLSDEGTIFENIAGRYSGNVNAEVFLKGYTGTELRVDRGDRSEFVSRPALTLGLTIQPTVIEDLPKKLRGNGFLARILFSRPVQMSGRRKARAPAVPADVAAAYHETLLSVAHQLYGFEDRVSLTFSPAADDLMVEIQEEIEPKLDPATGEWAHIADWAGKLAGQTARIAGLLHLAEHPLNPWNTHVSDTTVANAWCIARYYAAHAQATLEQIGADDTVRNAKTILARITDPAWPLGSRFKLRDAFRVTRHAGMQKMEDFKPAFELLADLGHVAAEAEPDRAGKTGRKPSPHYWLHPDYRTT
ncbi:YfjI family protein [Amycolatopsis nivea]